MDLPVMPPIRPMLAKARADVPDQPEGEPSWLYEPKWDGFRCVIFRDGDEVLLGSRNERPLTRYFPEVVEAIRAELPPRIVLDAELVVPRPHGDRTRLDWEALSQRIHPAASRISRLSTETPAQVIAFDCLAVADEALLDQPLRRRRAVLSGLVPAPATAPGTRTVHLSAATTDVARARRWFATFEGAGLDGVVAKRLGAPYQPDRREFIKVKHRHSADCVVLGYRPHKTIDGVGSLLLGLYRDGELHPIGGASAFSAAHRRDLLIRLQPLRLGANVIALGQANRWNQRQDHTFVPLRPELVVEIAYDQHEGSRLRHAGQVLRWRTDKAPQDCTFDQWEAPVRYDLADILDRADGEG